MIEYDDLVHAIFFCNLLQRKNYIKINSCCEENILSF